MNFLQGGMTTWIMVAVVVVIILVTIFSSIQKRKQDRIEKKRRQKEVCERIKEFLRENENISHKNLQYEKVIARSGKKYRNQDVFDVVVALYDSKTNQLFATKAFEVEGVTHQLSKKKYETTWKVNKELDLDVTLKRLEESKKKTKLTRVERIEQKQKMIKERNEERLLVKEERKIAKATKIPKQDLIQEKKKQVTQKFVPKR